MGFWILRPRRLPPYCLRDDLTEDYPAAYLDWLGEAWNGFDPTTFRPVTDGPEIIKTVIRRVEFIDLPGKDRSALAAAGAQ